MLKYRFYKWVREEITVISNNYLTFKENHSHSFVFTAILVINIASVLVSTVLLLVLPENRGRGFFELIRFAFTLMVNPSGRYIYSDYPISLIITTVVVLIGMISLTGGTVGYITSIIDGFLNRRADRKNKLNFRNHIVILNYNHRVPTLVCECCSDNARRTYVTILAEIDKKMIRNDIEQGISLMRYEKNRRINSRNIVIRTGNPMSCQELDSISLKCAKTVMIMSANDSFTQKDKEQNDIDTFKAAKLFMFVSCYLSRETRKRKPNIVVESDDRNIEKLIQESRYNFGSNSSGYSAISVNHKEILGKILAMTVLNPSIYDALAQVISFEGVEFYLDDSSKVDIEKELECSVSAMPIYELEIPEKEGKRYRVYISEDEKQLGRYSSNKDIKWEKLAINGNIGFSKEYNIVIIGTNSKLHYILESICCYKKSYHIDKLSVCLMDTAENEELLKEYYKENETVYGGIMSGYQIVDDIYNPIANFEENECNQGISSFLFLSDESVSDAQVDAKPILFWNGIKGSIGRKKNYIFEILDMQNQNIIERIEQGKVVVSDKFISSLYAQFIKDPRRFMLIRDLITFEGDSFLKTEENTYNNNIDICTLPVERLIKDFGESIEFSTKRELILSIYYSSRKAFIPFGCRIDGETFLFSCIGGKRTMVSKDGLDTAVLFNNESRVRRSGDRIKLKRNDELILLIHRKEFVENF